MKRILAAFVFLRLAELCFGQTATLDMSLNSARSYIEGLFPNGGRILVADTTAPTGELGAYIASELTTRLVNGRRLTVVERSVEVMETLASETLYQLSGEVHDDSIQSIGRKTGAEILLTGSVSGSGDSYRLIVKITSVLTLELLGQWSAPVQTDTTLNALLASANPPKSKPLWIYEPLSGREKYEPAPQTVSPWYYDVGISNKAASEQLARTRARQNIQQVVAENIASDMKARIDLTVFWGFSSSGIEETETRFHAALTNSIRTTVPRYETLEWYIETGNTDGKDWYLAYALVRFPRRDIITMVEKLDAVSIVDTMTRRLNLTIPAGGDERQVMIDELDAARVYALESIRDGYTGR